MAKVLVEWETADGRGRSDTFVTKDCLVRARFSLEAEALPLDWHLCYDADQTASNFIASLRRRGFRAEIVERIE